MSWRIAPLELLRRYGILKNNIFVVICTVIKLIMEPSNLSLKWYQKMRNIFLVGCGGIVVVVGGIFVGLMVEMESS
jgi:hypothetical protein